MNSLTAVADNGHIIAGGILISPCRATVLEAVCYFHGEVSIKELAEQNGGLFSYGSWYLHLSKLIDYGLVKKKVNQRRRLPKGYPRTHYIATDVGRSIIEDVHQSMM
jgi:predicted ArsR family transcriptional regulator